MLACRRQADGIQEMACDSDAIIKRDLDIRFHHGGDHWTDRHEFAKTVAQPALRSHPGRGFFLWHGNQGWLHVGFADARYPYPSRKPQGRLNRAGLTDTGFDIIGSITGMASL